MWGIYNFLSKKDIILAVMFTDLDSLDLLLQSRSIRRSAVLYYILFNLHRLSKKALSNYLSSGCQVALSGQLMPLLIEEEYALPDGHADCVIISLLYRVDEDVIIYGNS